MNFFQKLKLQPTIFFSRKIVIKFFIFLFIFAIIYIGLLKLEYLDNLIGLFLSVKYVILEYVTELRLESGYELEIESVTKSKDLVVNNMDGGDSSNIGTSGSGNSTGSGGTGTGTGTGTSTGSGSGSGSSSGGNTSSVTNPPFEG
jgi:hypothetical protein